MITSAGGIISLLDEPNPEFQCLALSKLIQNVDTCWPEIADVIIKIETLHEDAAFAERKRAALLASKVHFHLGSYEDALMFALGAGDLFNVNAHTEYTNTIISKAIDQYAKLQQHNNEVANDADKKPVDPRLEGVVNKMFARCFAHRQYKQAIGIALESRRLDMFEKAIEESDDKQELLAYAVKVVLSLLQNRKYRNETLKCLVKLYSKLEKPDYINMCQCLIFLEDPVGIADILEQLCKESENSTLIGYQIAFDLYESATQQYVIRIIQSLRGRAPISIPVVALDLASATSSDPTASASGGGSDEFKEALESDESDAKLPGKAKAKDAGETSKTGSTTPPPSPRASPPPPPPGDDKAGEKFGDAMETETGATPKSSSPPMTPPETSTAEKSAAERAKLSPDQQKMQDRLEKLVIILSGNETIGLHMQFLIKNNHTDMLILKTIKDNVRNSVGHTATVICNGFMHVGTTCDDFLRTNLEWVGKATNWAKFTAVSSLGVIHRGHEKDAVRLLESYLPKESSAGTTGYMEGGGLYALGLIYANHGHSVLDYLKNQLSVATAENVRHGACLGTGLAAMGTQRQDVYEQLRNNLYQDDAITGEAAGISLGLVMLGSAAPNVIQDMVAYARETQHEKILRGLSLGISLVMYGRLEEADPLIENLLLNKDHIMRRSGVFTLALAYVGTGSNAAIRKLLHIAVSDVNDDVKRAAVTSLGFLLFRTPEQCPTMVSLLSESYNAHVRYGAAMALGIACAGTGLKDAIALLEPMLNDPVNYVRQGCVMAMAMIMIQHNTIMSPKVKEFRETLTKMIQDKHEDIMAKFGAIIAQGILDAGGRNVTISLQSRNRQTDLSAVVGILLFLQHWYWFPLAHCLSLAFRPTAIIGLNSDLKMPKMEFLSKARPSTFAYPPILEEKKEKQAEKVETAVLSVTAKAKRKEKQKQEQEVKMDVDEAPGSPRVGRDKSPDVKTGRSTSPATAAAATTKSPGKEAPASPGAAKDRKSRSRSASPAIELKKQESMDAESGGARAKSPARTGKDQEGDKKPTGGDDKEKKEETVKEPEPEPEFVMLENPARVVQKQLQVLSIPPESRYTPLKKVSIGGIILMQDKQSGEPAELVEIVKAGGETKQEEETEPEAPEAFVYDESLEE